MNRAVYSVVVLFLLTTTLIAQEKVLERSTKKMPEWAKNLTEAQFLIMQGEHYSLSGAKQQAIQQIKQEMVRSIAEQIISTSIRTVQEQEKQTQETYSKTITTKAAKVPYLRGISEAQLSDFYWEKVQNKKNKGIVYRYYAKYPFNATQLRKLVAEFREEEEKLANRINTLQASIKDVNSIEQIDAAIQELSKLMPNLDETQKTKAHFIQSRYRSLYESVVITEVAHSLGKLSYQLNIGKRIVYTTRKPTIKKGCTSILQTKLDTINKISYRYDGCYNDKENFIRIIYRLGDNNLEEKFLVPLKYNLAQ
ncbi:MAG: hypothetical protein ACRCSB_03775 [Bacteroidales bacterium]